MSGTVYIQQRKGQWSTPACYSAWYGFKELGYEVVPFTYKALCAKKYPLTKETIVLGGVAAVREALSQIGAPDPPNIDLPAVLHPFLGRKIWKSVMKDIRQIERYEPPIHVKPLEGHKLFTGKVIRRRDDLLGLTDVDGNVPVLVQECIDFISEYRFYVLNAKVLGVGFYTGNPLRFPAGAVVEQLIRAFTAAPAAYGLDVGVTVDGRTLLVEVNDGFALGNYGISPWDYARFVQQRWLQLVGLLE